MIRLRRILTAFLEHVLCLVLSRRACLRPIARVKWIIGLIRTQTMQLRTNERFRLTPQFKNERDEILLVEGIPRWGSDNPVVATVEPEADGLSAVVRAHSPGVANITVAADIDLSASVYEIEGTYEVTVALPDNAVVTFEATIAEQDPDA